MSLISRSRRGQAITEYLILTALVAVGSIAVVQVLGSNIQARLAVISEAIRGQRKEIQGTEAQKKHYEMRDLGDFQGAIRDNSSGDGE